MVIKHDILVIIKNYIEIYIPKIQYKMILHYLDWVFLKTSEKSSVTLNSNQLNKK